MTIEKDKWIIETRAGFSAGGDVLEFADETGALLDLTDLTATMRVSGWGREEEFTAANGNFVLLPFVAPATFASKWEFKLTVAEVESLKTGDNNFEVIIGDQNDNLIGFLGGTIRKRK